MYKQYRKVGKEFTVYVSLKGYASSFYYLQEIIDEIRKDFPEVDTKEIFIFHPKNRYGFMFNTCINPETFGYQEVRVFY